MDAILEQRKEAERRERVERIVSAGKKVLLEKGYFETTIRDIAREAALSPGTIYYYFTGIDEIYSRICEEAFEIVLRLLNGARNDGSSVFDRLRSLAGAYFTFYSEYNDYFQLFIFHDRGYRKVGLERPLVNRLDELSRQTVRILQEVIQEGIDGKEIVDVDSSKLAVLLWGSIEGLLFLDTRDYLKTYGLDIEDMLRIHIDILTAGIKG